MHRVKCTVTSKFRQRVGWVRPAKTSASQSGTASGRNPPTQAMEMAATLHVMEPVRPAAVTRSCSRHGLHDLLRAPLRDRPVRAALAPSSSGGEAKSDTPRRNDVATCAGKGGWLSRRATRPWTRAAHAFSCRRHALWPAACSRSVLC
jgi:hypothetical protein